MENEVRLSKKVVLLGDPGVGKTSMIKKFVYDLFDDKYITTLGTKVTTKEIPYPHPEREASINVKLAIWDLMGQKEYKILHQAAFMGSKGALVVCDLTRRDTLENLPHWITSLFDITDQIPIVIIGNKNDIPEQAQITYEELQEIAKTFNVPTYLTSAKTGINVNDAFETLGKDIVTEHYKKKALESE